MTAPKNAPVTAHNAPCAPSGNDATDAPIAATARHDARVRELGALLATGYIRALLSAANSLALPAETKPCCDANAVNAPRVLGRAGVGEHP